MAASGAAPICGAPLAGSTLPLTGPSTTSCGRLTNAARAALLGGAEGVGDHFRQRVRRGHLDGVFRHRAEHRHRIHTLVDLFGFIGAFHRAAQGHHRVAFAVGGGHTGDQVGAARAGGDQRHAGFTGNAPDGGGHKRGVGFVAYRNNANGGIQQ
jgi:hypothetical protein